jgi:hypothetical protein
MSLDYAKQIEKLKITYFQLLDDKLRDYRTILATIDKVYRLLSDEPERPPTFPAIVGRPYDENFISDYLAYILDPARNGIGIKPLQALLSLVSNAYTEAEFESVDIRRECTFASGGRIDFLIVVDKSLVIGIENKIFSSEGEKQTDSYEKSIKQEFAGFDHILIYLAPGEHKPGSKAFQHVSYKELFDAFRRIRFPWTQDVRRGFFWEDFLTHLEEYITMNSGVPEISEKTRLYLDNIKVVRDIQSAFERDNGKLYDYLIAKVASSYEGGNWKLTKHAEKLFIAKRSWQQKQVTVFFAYRFSKEILSTTQLACSLEIQGYDRGWNKSPHIDTFIELLVELHPTLQDEIKARKLQYRPAVRPWAVARNTYELKPNPEDFDRQFSRAIKEFSFLIEVVDKTIAAYEG